MPSACALRRCAAVAIAMIGLGAGTSAWATPSAEVSRLAGEDRYETARALALHSFDRASTAFIASGIAFPDALAANGIAGSRVGPVLLVSDQVPAATSQTLVDLGVEEVVILGGTDAVSAAVQDSLDDDYAVTRLAGQDRIDTAVEIAHAIDAGLGIGAFDGRRAAFLARADVFADALVVGPLAYNLSIPVLLSSSNALSPATAGALDDLDIEVVVVAGGAEAISNAVEASVEALGIDVIRLAGTDRTRTATAVADFAVAELGFGESHTNVARGDKFPDAMTGGPHAGDLEMSTILLTTGTSLGEASTAWITSRCSSISSVHVYGGTVAVSDATVGEITQAARSC